MNVSIFGLGYVGCVSLACLAKSGHTVIGVDLNDTKVQFINDGKPTIVEKDIEGLVRQASKAGLISATGDGAQAVVDTEVSFICVGTPSTASGHLDLNGIFKVAEEIAEGLKNKNRFHVIVIRSTVLPGTNEKVVSVIQEVSQKTPEKDFTVVSNPEFLREGSAVSDFFSPAYTVIGSENQQAIDALKELYSAIDAPFIVAQKREAEILKYVNNAFHALKVTFANEIGKICKQLAIDSHHLMDIFCHDTKLNISPYYLKPGFSYGGSCLPKDLKALKTIAHDGYLECPLLETIERSNELHRQHVLNQIISCKKQNVGVLGLSFKKGTDDLRNSPIVDVIEVLLGKGFNLKIYDRNVHLAKLVGANRDYIMNKIPFISSFITDDEDEIIDHAELVIVVNNEDNFSGILARLPESCIIYDLVNISFENRSEHPNYSGISW